MSTVKGLFGMSKNQRVRLTAYSTNISNVVLTQYHQLSDGAKLTYFVLESYDWPDEHGKSKGKCWPAIDTLAQARGKSYDTIMRHLKELEKAALIQIESGQETGTTNCYQLLGPSSAEMEVYIKNFGGKPCLPKAIEQAEAESQNYGTPSLTNAVAGNAVLPHHEESNMNKQNKHEDSNHKSSTSVNLPNLQTQTNIKQAPYLSKLMDDFSRSLNDTEHAASNRSQILNLYYQSGLEEKSFVQMLYEAKKRTQWANVKSTNPVKGGPNRAAYFFRVVRDLITNRNQILQPNYLHNTN